MFIVRFCWLPFAPETIKWFIDCLIIEETNLIPTLINWDFILIKVVFKRRLRSLISESLLCLLLFLMQASFCYEVRILSIFRSFVWQTYSSEPPGFLTTGTRRQVLLSSLSPQILVMYFLANCYHAKSIKRDSSH